MPQEITDSFELQVLEILYRNHNGAERAGLQIDNNLAVFVDASEAVGGRVTVARAIEIWNGSIYIPPQVPSYNFVPPAAPLMPADLAALAFPDESLADLKLRLLTDLTRLRSMAVGRLDMTDAERAMLTTLEGQVAQQWFSS